MPLHFPGTMSHRKYIFKILFLEFPVCPSGEGDERISYFDCVCLDGPDGFAVDEVAFGGDGELAGADGFEFFLEGGEGLAGGELTVSEEDGEDVAVGFSVEDVVQFFYADASFHFEYDSFAVSESDAVNRPFHCLVELVLGEGFQEVVGRIHGEGIDGIFVAGGEKYDFALSSFPPKLSGDVGTEKPGHADIEEDDIKGRFRLDVIHEGKGIVVQFIGDLLIFSLEIVHGRLMNEADLVFHIVTNRYTKHRSSFPGNRNTFPLLIII